MRRRTSRRLLGAVLGVALGGGVLAVGLPLQQAAQATQTGGAVIAYQDAGSSHFLTTVTSDGVLHPIGLGMAPGTSPAVAQQQDGRYWAAVQANDGHLWTVDPQLTGHQEKVQMAPGTNPGVGFETAEQSPVFWAHAADDHLARLQGIGAADNNPDGGVMGPGASPGAGQEQGGAVYRNSDGVIAPLSVDDGRIAPGTNPSLAVSLTPSGAHVDSAFQGGDNDLRYVLQPPFPNTPTEVDTRLGMEPGTSPAVAVQPDGTFEVAFQANTKELWIVDSSGQGHPTGLGMDPATSPSITALASGGFEIAFQTNAHALWTVGADGVGRPVDNAKIQPGTNPSINAYLPMGTATAPPTASPVPTSPVPTTPVPTPTATAGQATLSLTEQQVTSGPIPFAGKFPPLGSTRPGKVLSITYPASGFLDTSLKFVKTGHSSSQCNVPSDVVVLPEGQTTTPSQLLAIFGTSTPTFSTLSPFSAVACFSGPDPTPSFINLPMAVQFT